MSHSVIAVQGLNYFYPGKQVLFDVGFTISQGEITALVGPNGAGKTTLMRLLAALDSPYSGTIAVAGVDAGKNPRLVHARAGYLSDSFGLYDNLTVHQVLEYIAGCHNLDGATGRERVEWAGRLLSLEGVLDQKCKTLSRGWRQRAGIAMAILHRPDVLFLDEPASGLDPESRADLSGILKSLQREGMTILVSSHILAELEEYCTAMLVLREGRIRDHVSLKAHQDAQTATVVVRLAVPLPHGQEAGLHDIVPGCRVMIDADRSGFRIVLTRDPAQHHEVLRLLLARGLPVCMFAAEERKLNALYLQLAKSGTE